MRKPKAGNAYLEFLLSEAAKPPVNEAGMLDKARDSLLSKFSNTETGQRAQGRIDARQLAADMKRAWARYAGQMEGSPWGEPTPRNIQRWLKKRYDLDIALNPNQTAAEPKPQAQNSAEQPAQAQAEPQQQQPNAEANPAQSAGPSNELPGTEASGVEQEIDALKKVIMTRYNNPDAKMLEPGSRSPDQYLNYLRMGLQALGLNDPRTDKPPFGEALTGTVGKAMATLTISLVSADSEQKIRENLDALKAAVGQSGSTNDQKAVNAYLDDAFADPEFQRMHPFLRDLKQELTQDEKVQQSPMAKLAPASLFARVAAEAQRLKDSKVNPPAPMQARFVEMVQALRNRAAQEPDEKFKENVRELLDQLAIAPSLLKRVPALSGVLQTQASESYSPSYLGYLFESNGLVLNEDELDLDGRLTGEVLDRFFMMAAQQLLASTPAPGRGGGGGGSSRGPAGAPNAQPSGNQGRGFNPQNFADLIRHECQSNRVAYDRSIASEITNLVSHQDWDGLDRALTTLKPEWHVVVTMAALRAMR